MHRSFDSIPWIILLCFILGIALFPVIKGISSHLPGEGDPLLILWILLHDEGPHSHPLQAPFLYPNENALALTEPFIGLRPIARLLYQWGVTPITIYNTFVLLGFLLVGLTTFFVVRFLSASNLAALVASMALTINPYRWYHLPRLQMIHSEWILPAVLCLMLVFYHRKPVWIIPAAVFLALQWLFCIYYGVFLFFIMVIFFLCCLLFPSLFMNGRNTLPTNAPSFQDPPLRHTRSLRITCLRGSLIGLSLGGILYFMAYLFSPFLEWFSFLENPFPYSMIESYSAQWKDFLVGLGPLRIPGSGAWARIEGFLFPGYAVLLLSFLGLFYRRSVLRNSGVIFFLVGVILSFGVHLPGYDFIVSIYPLLHAIRAPIRWHVVTLTGLSLLSASGVAFIEQHRPKFIRWLTPVLLFFMFAGTWQIPPWRDLSWVEIKRPVHTKLLKNPDSSSPVITLPAWTEYGPMSIMLFWQLQHQHPITGGLVPRFPPSSMFLFSLFQQMPREEVLDAMQKLRIRQILVYPYLSQDPKKLHRQLEMTRKIWQPFIRWQTFGPDQTIELLKTPPLPLFRIPSRTNSRRLKMNCEVVTFNDTSYPAPILTNQNRKDRLRWPPNHLKEIRCHLHQPTRPVFLFLRVGTHTVVDWKVTYRSSSDTPLQVPILRWDIASTVRSLPWIREVPMWHRSVKLYILPPIVTDTITLIPDVNHQRHPAALHEITLLALTP